MLDFFLQKSVVISLAVIGGTLSLLVSWLTVKGVTSERTIKFLNKTAYAFMGASMILFVTVGLL